MANLLSDWVSSMGALDVVVTRVLFEEVAKGPHVLAEYLKSIAPSLQIRNKTHCCT